MRKKTFSEKLEQIILHIMFIVVVLICVIPVILVFSISFTPEQLLIKDGYKFIPAEFSPQAYKYIFTGGVQILNAYAVTIFVTVFGTILSVFVIAMYAYPLSRKGFRYRRGFTIYIFITMLFSGGMVPWYLVCTQILHLQNTIFALILPYLLNTWNVIVMRTFFITNIPDSLAEAARIDGANELLIFIRIALPLSLPGLATIGLFSALGYWNDWYLPFMLISRKELYNLQFLLYKMMTNIQQMITFGMNGAVMSGEKIPTESTRMALCVITIGPVILMYPFFQRYFIGGLTVGSIKE